MEKFIAFFEIPAADFHRAVGFYETVLDIKLAVSEYEEEKMACFMEQGGAVGAVSWADRKSTRLNSSHASKSRMSSSA